MARKAALSSGWSGSVGVFLVLVVVCAAVERLWSGGREDWAASQQFREIKMVAAD